MDETFGNHFSQSKKYLPSGTNRIKKTAEMKKVFKQRGFIFVDMKSFKLQYWILSTLNLRLKKASSGITCAS